MSRRIHVRVIEQAREVISKIKSRHGSIKTWFGVLKLGGHGDTMVAIAVARALRQWVEKEFESDPIGIIVIARTTGHQVDVELFQGVDFIDGWAKIPSPDWSYAVRALTREFDLLFDVQYVVGMYSRDPGSFGRYLIQNQSALKQFSFYYSGFPLTNYELSRHFWETQWELMSATAPFPITPRHLFISTELKKEVQLNEGITEKLKSLEDSSKLVAIHHGQGGHGHIKVPPRGDLEFISCALGAAGYVPVQIGADKDEPLRGCLNLRGLSLNASARVIQACSLLVSEEGLPPYLARAVGTPMATYIGPTPESLFAFPKEIDASTGKVIFPGATVLQSDHCFPCWWHKPTWNEGCKQNYRSCIRFPNKHDAARTILETLEDMK